MLARAAAGEGRGVRGAGPGTATAITPQPAIAKITDRAAQAHAANVRHVTSFMLSRLDPFVFRTSNAITIPNCCTQKRWSDTKWHAMEMVISDAILFSHSIPLPGVLTQIKTTLIILRSFMKRPIVLYNDFACNVLRLRYWKERSPRLHRIIKAPITRYPAPQSVGYYATDSHKSQSFLPSRLPTVHNVPRRSSTHNGPCPIFIWAEP